MGAIENIRVSDLTVGQLAQLMREIMAETALRQEPTEVEVHEDYTDGNLAYGIGGIADLLGCSRTYAQRLKSSGVLDPAINQYGRKIICDKAKALEIFGSLNHLNHRK